MVFWTVTSEPVGCAQTADAFFKARYIFAVSYCSLRHIILFREDLVNLNYENEFIELFLRR